MSLCDEIAPLVDGAMWDVWQYDVPKPGWEQDADYCRIAEARLAYWMAQPQQNMLR